MTRYVWQTKGSPHCTPEMVRAQKRFRRHIHSPARPQARIIRPWWCHRCRGVVVDRPIEAHHPDYTRPFLVAWLCFDCHRAHERGDFKVGSRLLCDYASLVPTREYQIYGARTKKVREPTPF